MECINQTETKSDRHVFILKSMFYLLSPEETFYENTEDVSNLIQDVGYNFVILIVLEQLIFYIKNGRFNGNISDGIASVGAGTIYGFPSLIFRNLGLVAYEWTYLNFNIYDLKYDSKWTYLFAFIFIDMLYYWFHRAAHEINFIWAAHQTHHSSEEYNLTTALRKSIFQKQISWIFYLPAALFLRPSLFLIHTHLNQLFQFWIHTELVKNLGPLEYIFNTPSHHRVHHGRNPYCIDKNYAGVLIIWDRMFGTFQKEKHDEELAYGLVHRSKTFDPTHIQIFYYKYLFQKFFSVKCLNERLSVLFKGPGWVPGSDRLRNKDDLPQIDYPIVKISPKNSNILNIYICVHFAFILLAFTEYVKINEKYPALFTNIFIVLFFLNLTIYGMYSDGNSKAIYIDLMRLAIQTGFIFYCGQDLEIFFLSSTALFQIYKILNLYSFIIILVITGFNIKDCLMIIFKNKKLALIKKENHRQYDRIYAAHKNFHVRMGMRQQTIRKSKEKNFKE